MAIFYCEMNTVSRGEGRSIVAASAYRNACKLEDSRTGKIHNYTQKQGVESSEIYLPSGINAAWAQDRQRLWNAAEKAEKRKDARLGREIVLALPAELPSGERQKLAGDMARYLADRYGLAVDVAIHKPSRQGDARNHHAHLLMSARRVTEEGFGAKTQELDDWKQGPKEIEQIRIQWERMANRALERAGLQSRIDHRSLKAQGVRRAPTVHLGPSACAMERRGIRTRLGDINREASSLNEHIARQEQDLLQLERMKTAQQEMSAKSLTPAAEIRAGIDAARKRFFNERVTRVVAKAEAEKREQQRKQQEAEREKERAALEKQYGRAIRMIVSPKSPEMAHVCSEYGKYLDRLQSATSEKRAEMVKELQKAEDNYNIRCTVGQLFYSYAKVVSHDTSISGWERVRDTMLKEWDRSTPEMRKQMEREVKEYVRTHEHQKVLGR